MNQNPNPRRHSRIWLLCAWTWAGVPLIWGVFQTVLKAEVLFH